MPQLFPARPRRRPLTRPLHSSVEGTCPSALWKMKRLFSRKDRGTPVKWDCTVRVHSLSPWTGPGECPPAALR